MMDLVLYNFLSDVPRAASIWIGLLVLALLVMAAFVARPGRDRDDPEPDDGVFRLSGETALSAHTTASGGTPVGASGEAAGPVAPAVTNGAAARAAELRRYAEEVTVAAERAATTAHRRREEWLTAQAAVDTSWQALEAAEAALRRVSAAAAFPLPRTPQTPAEYADRERYLHREAMAACCRNELSVLALSDALAHRNGWNPRLHPVQQELVLRRVARDTCRAAHVAAVDREREAWRTAELASAAARSLRQEAFAAAQRAHRTRPALASADQPAGPARAVARWRTAQAG